MGGWGKVLHFRLESSGHKPRSRHRLGRLAGAEAHSGKVGARQRASSSDWPELFERSAQRARSEFEGPTLPRAPQGSHAKGMTTHMAPEPMPEQPRPALPRKTANQQASNNTTRQQQPAELKQPLKPPSSPPPSARSSSQPGPSAPEARTRTPPCPPSHPSSGRP